MNRPGDDRRRMLAGFDRLEAVVLAVYAVLLGILALAAVGALAFLILNAPPGFGQQGEWFFVAIGLLLVIGWIASQVAGILRRMRGLRTLEEDVPLDLARAIMDQGGLPGGLTLRWGAAPEEDRAGGTQPGLSWSFQSAPTASRIIKVDEAQLAAARSRRDAGESWEAIGPQINPDYDSLSPLEQEFYRRALQMAVDEGSQDSSVR